MTEMTETEQPEGEAAPPPGAAPAARMPLWIRVLLVGSLALNLLVAGVLVGAWVGRGDHGRHAAMARDPGAMLYLGALSEGDRAALMAAMRSDRPDREARRAETVAEARATLQALRAEPFDPGAFADRLRHQRARSGERAQRGEALLVDRIASMSPAERQAYADRLEETLRRLAGWGRD